MFERLCVWPVVRRSVKVLPVLPLTAFLSCASGAFPTWCTVTLAYSHKNALCTMTARMPPIASCISRNDKVETSPVLLWMPVQVCGNTKNVNNCFHMLQQITKPKVALLQPLGCDSPYIEVQNQVKYGGHLGFFSSCCFRKLLNT